jgi:hypothetical protein
MHTFVTFLPVQHWIGTLWLLEKETSVDGKNSEKVSIVYNYTVVKVEGLSDEEIVRAVREGVWLATVSADKVRMYLVEGEFTHNNPASDVAWPYVDIDYEFHSEELTER